MGEGLKLFHLQVANKTVLLRVGALAATKRPGDYDQAVKLLKDLWDLGIRSGRSTEIQAHIHQLQHQRVNKPSFLRRLAQGGLALL